MDGTKDISELLNPNQLEAVTYCDGASVIVAGAGSGKTRVLTYKIAYLIQNGFSAASILALTFTNKASREMKERIADIIGEKLASYLWMGTFHSIFLKILQRETYSIGYQPNFTIYDTMDAKSLVKSIIREMRLDEKIYTVQSVYSRISKMKNLLVTPQTYRVNNDYTVDDFHRNKQSFADIFETYCSRCKASNAMDFDDILLYTFFLFKNNPEILERYQKRFAYILVDEYQDTNIAQHRIINLLAAKHKMVCVVGDDAQSIYSFRGANIDNILYFQKSFDGCKLFKLEENYRSTKTIVNTANALISKNRLQIPKKVYSNLHEGEKIKILSCFSDRNESEAVADEIDIAVSNSVELSQMTVIYRTNAQSRVFEETLRSRHIPYKIYAGNSFYSRKEIKDVLAYMRLIINHSDEESLKRIINYPTRGIGDTTRQKLLDLAHKTNSNVLDLIFEINTIDIDMNTGARSKVNKFGDLIISLTKFYNSNDAYLTAEKIIVDSGILDDISSDSDPENVSRKENVQELLSAIHEYCAQKQAQGEQNPSLAEFLAEVSLLTDQDADNEENKDKITLMTIHAAKGLEFEYVFIAGLEEELFPSPMCETEHQLEEERRLFYVAITRARERCFISYAKTRFKHGQVQYSMPSRFLEDLDEQYLEMPKVFNQYSSSAHFSESEPKAAVFPTFRNETFASKKAVNYGTQNKTKYPVTDVKSRFKPISQIDNATASTMKFDFKIGDTVEHNVFGSGKILELSGENDNTKAKIQFNTLGTKQLLLKYSKLVKK
ncbi:MAG: UvrD-helicase domain-containing protein [Prevotellaceae bacterium]|jgi:DNA helicase-2/ATP-dependent DNA helicase PcrA|nr:UvrD-helicase domain-containing protein [Prevotellaceae bacterium]